MAKFECSVCVGDYPLSKKVECPSCDYIVCATCQKTVMRGSCMNCHAVFTNKFMVAALGKAWVSTTFRRHQENEMFEAEKALCAATQPLVDWERERRVGANNARFRIPRNNTPRPIIAEVSGRDLSTDVFPCPATSCRGFVTRGVCGVCKADVCIRCREAKGSTSGASHECTAEALASIALINAQCRPCPQCGVSIYRTDGCDHMFCVACHTHWNWISGAVMTNSTNHHYNNAARFAENIATRGIVPGEAAACEEETVHQLMRDLVPRETFDEGRVETMYVDLVVALYDDPQVVRLTKANKYDERAILIKTRDTLSNYRVQYMLGEMTEPVWKSRIYTVNKQRDRDTHVAQVINIYLSTVRTFQHMLMMTHDYIGITEQMKAFTAMCNDSFASLHEEYGGPWLKLRADLANRSLPALVM